MQGSPTTKENLAWFQQRRERWKNAPRPRVVPLTSHGHALLTSGSSTNTTTREPEEISAPSIPKEGTLTQAPAQSFAFGSNTTTAVPTTTSDATSHSSTTPNPPHAPSTPQTKPPTNGTLTTESSHPISSAPSSTIPSSGAFSFGSTAGGALPNTSDLNSTSGQSIFAKIQLVAPSNSGMGNSSNEVSSGATATFGTSTSNPSSFGQTYSAPTTTTTTSIFANKPATTVAPSSGQMSAKSGQSVFANIKLVADDTQLTKKASTATPQQPGPFSSTSTTPYSFGQVSAGHSAAPSSTIGKAPTTSTLVTNPATSDTSTRTNQSIFANITLVAEDTPSTKKDVTTTIGNPAPFSSVSATPFSFGQTSTAPAVASSSMVGKSTTATTSEINKSLSEKSVKPTQSVFANISLVPDATANPPKQANTTNPSQLASFSSRAAKALSFGQSSTGFSAIGDTSGTAISKSNETSVKTGQSVFANINLVPDDALFKKPNSTTVPSKPGPFSSTPATPFSFGQTAESLSAVPSSAFGKAPLSTSPEIPSKPTNSVFSNIKLVPDNAASSTNASTNPFSFAQQAAGSSATSSSTFGKTFTTETASTNSASSSSNVGQSVFANIQLVASGNTESEPSKN